MNSIKRRLSFFTRHGIKITYLTRVIFIHCDSHLPYQGLLNIVYGYKERLSYNEKTAKWLSKYYPFNNSYK